MRHTIVRTGIVIALLGLSACSPKMAMEEDGGVVAAPVVVESKSLDCKATGMEDGIGGTGCPAID